MKAFEVDFSPKETEHTILQKQNLEKEDKHRKLKEEKEERKKLELAMLEAEFKQERNSRLAAIKADLTEGELADLKIEFEELIQGNDFLMKQYVKSGFDNIAIRPKWDRFLVERYLLSKYWSFENYQLESASGGLLGS